MKTISLKLYLMVLIFLIASVCLFFTAAFVLYQSHAKFLHKTILSAESIDKQLEVQLVFGIGKGFQSSELFPNFDFWTKSEHSSGLCVHFERANGKIIKRACRGAKMTEQWPRWFNKFYRWLFLPGEVIKRPVMQNNKIYGFISVLPHVEAELAYAWHDVKTLMRLSVTTVISLCTLLYFALDWALRPARQIITGLEKMAKGNLSFRLTDFKITEWHKTGQAINQLTENLHKTLSDRNQLALKLVNTQEQERRNLTRELHDEFGQSLAGLAAIASSITYTAEKECPQLVAESQNIGRISTKMMEVLRGMLIHLRPVDIDELGLTESLHSMVAQWNGRSGGKIRYGLEIIGDFDNLPDNFSVNLYRIIQECLTNIAKHSNATRAKVKLEKSKSVDKFNASRLSDKVLLTIEDDGIGETIKMSGTSGIGLLGMRERVIALGGKLTFKANKPGGLIIQVRIPLHTDEEYKK